MPDDVTVTVTPAAAGVLDDVTVTLTPAVPDDLTVTRR
ncbi:hypothetical protein BJY18_005007 [Amycolatopsis jiangsuensis]|uniref:Uncharacterized protein n=1 Tax=Amycolatopsis jiangsuensis TaxID=1181879 RepID=A0A840J266_9PSEU|nr:hypothetical protein [Amycolatopsis jiangsuensis]